LLTLQTFLPNKYFVGNRVLYKKYLYITAIYLFYMSLYGWSEAFSRFVLFSDPIWNLNPEQRIFEFTNDAVLFACHRLVTYETYNTLNQIYFNILDFSTTLHHLVAATAMFIALNTVYGHYLLCFLTGPIFFNTVFVSLRDRALDFTPSIQLILDACFAFSFIIIRVFWMSSVMLSYAWDLALLPEKSALEYLVMILTYLFLGLHYFWGHKVFRKVKSILA